MRIEIRKATIQDSAGLARVQVDSYQRSYAKIFQPDYLRHFTYDEQEKDWRDLLASETKDIVIVTESELGEIMGYALGRSSHQVPPYDGELFSLHVDRSHQGGGIGRHLVGAVAEQLRQRGCRSLMLWVLEENPSREFYEHLGGELLSASKMTEGAVDVVYGWPAIESLYGL